MKSGFTLVEVILSIALISIIAVFFIPGITFGYIHLIDSKKYTEEIFIAQDKIENLMEIKKKETPTGPNIEKTIFGMKVNGHNLKIDIEEFGEINVFQPKKEYVYPELKIVRDINSGISNIVLLSVLNNSGNVISPRPDLIKMYNTNGVLNTTNSFLVDKKYYKVNDSKIFLVNVYRWYISSMVGYTAGFGMDNYFIIKEWNAARPIVTYENARTSKFIPNIQNEPDYNRLKFDEIVNGLYLTDTELINQFGNRFFYYSVTPFAVSGKMGNEEYSNSIYVEAPRIEIQKAIFGPEANQVSIYFKEDIGETFSEEKITPNKDLGNLIGISRDKTKKHIAVLEFDKSLNWNLPIDENILSIGSVNSLKYGAIQIWSNNKPVGEFIIKKN